MKYETVHCRDAIARSFVAKVQGEVFTQSPENVAVDCGIERLACQDKLFVNNNLRVKENDEHGLGFSFHLTRLSFPVSVSLNFPCTAQAFFPKLLCNHCEGLRCTFPRSIARNETRTFLIILSTDRCSGTMICIQRSKYPGFPNVYEQAVCQGNEHVYFLVNATIRVQKPAKL
jgi:Fe-S-cluster-containing dehydrogenase component